MLKKIGVLSDTHLTRVTKELTDIVDRHLSGVEMILHAGDFVSAELVQFFHRMNFRGVHGNMDVPAVKASLPEKETIQVGPWKIGLIHGWGSPDGIEDRIRVEFPDVDVIVYGHAHLSANHTKDGVLLFNPGTAAGYNPSGINSVGVLEFGERIKGEIIEI
ncbi:MAG: YfcE family phosphodiesterase [Desulfobacteraceae bacterium]|nr:MAG: YfcE family phosphodiesterase [Desulfobacteraceae bacterium]